MRLVITSDADWESRVGTTLNRLTDFPAFEQFDEIDYGPGLASLGIIFMCQPNDLGLTPRIKLSKKKKAFYMDIMLDLELMKAADQNQRQRVIAQRLYDEVPAVLSQQRIPEFDQARFVADLHRAIDGTDWRWA